MDLVVGAIIRTATAADSEALIALVRASWSGYAGVVFDLDGELPELKELAGHHAARGGNAWVAVLQGAVAGCVATTPEPASDNWTLHKLNVLPSARRHGIGRALVKIAENRARGGGAREMTLWSDTRYIESHALYRSLGYAQTIETRQLNDLSNTTEILFRKTL